MGIEETTILIEDLEEARQLVAACLTYFTAKDVARAQVTFGTLRKSALTLELEAVKERLDGIFGDYLLARYEVEKTEEPGEEIHDPDAEGVSEGGEGDDESDGTDDTGELSSLPLGEPQYRRRRSRIMEPEASVPEEVEDDE